MDFLKIALMLAMTFFCVGVGFLMFVLGNDLFKDWKKQMNIEEIRAEIPKAYATTYCMKRWLYENGVEDAYSMDVPDVIPSNARILVDMAYEAGKAVIPECLECKSGDYEKGFKAGKAEAIVVPDNAAIAKADHEGFERGYEAAAKDPKAWYVLDKNGEKGHIGDPVKLTNNETVHIQGLGSCAIFAVPRGSGYTIFESDYFEKVIPDTREKIKEELAGKISTIFAKSFEDQQNIAEQFISRIEALEMDK